MVSQYFDRRVPFVRFLRWLCHRNLRQTHGHVDVERREPLFKWRNLGHKWEQQQEGNLLLPRPGRHFCLSIPLLCSVSYVFPINIRSHPSTFLWHSPWISKGSPSPSSHLSPLRCDVSQFQRMVNFTEGLWIVCVPWSDVWRLYKVGPSSFFFCWRLQSTETGGEFVTPSTRLWQQRFVEIIKVQGTITQPPEYWEQTYRTMFPFVSQVILRNLSVDTVRGVFSTLPNNYKGKRRLSKHFDVVNVKLVKRVRKKKSNLNTERRINPLLTFESNSFLFFLFFLNK